jgi:hypothetical protein
MQQQSTKPFDTPALVYPASPRRAPGEPSKATVPPGHNRSAENAASRRRIGPIASALAGFAAGVTFWHLVGFWGFISTVVHKPERPVRAQADLAIDGDVGTALTLPVRRAAQTVDASVAACSSLVLGRETNDIRVLPCPVNAQPLPDGGGATRGDLEAVRKAAARRAPAVATWSATIFETTVAKPR